ncbi:MAG TPA: thioredoxin domain-containing protein [Saprospiraceae bacterium]|nr:thioredoxin domain-containing protein [Saprospiraceae bacterium]
MQRMIGVLFLCLLGILDIQAQGIEFMEGDWKAALAKAKKEKKLIFVDAYASWCGPCKRMAATVFTQKEAGDFYNEKFINFKIDMEKGEGPAFGGKYPVRAYPTLMFIDYDGELVHQKVGAQTLTKLIALGETALSKVDRSEQYVEKYEKGDRSAELIYNYLFALNQAGKPSLKIANDYLREPDGDLASEINLKIIFEALLQVDSRVYTLFDQYKQGIKALYSQAEIDEKLLAAGNRTVQTAITFESPDILAEAQQKVAAQCSEAVADAFRIKSEIAYALVHGDDKAYASALKDYNKELAGADNINADYDIVKEGLDRLGDKKVNKELVKLMETIVGYPDVTYQTWLAYADVLSRTGDDKEALKALDKAKNMTKNGRIRAKIIQMRDQIEKK